MSALFPVFEQWTAQERHEYITVACTRRTSDVEKVEKCCHVGGPSEVYSEQYEVGKGLYMSATKSPMTDLKNHLTAAMFIKISFTSQFSPAGSLENALIQLSLPLLRLFCIPYDH